MSIKLLVLLSHTNNVYELVYSSQPHALFGWDSQWEGSYPVQAVLSISIFRAPEYYMDGAGCEPALQHPSFRMNHIVEPLLQAPADSQQVKASHRMFDPLTTSTHNKVYCHDKYWCGLDFGNNYSIMIITSLSPCQIAAFSSHSNRQNSLELCLGAARHLEVDL